MKKIFFNKTSDFAGITGHGPTPSSKALPKWYRSIHKYTNGKLSFDGKGNPGLTVKSCPPFLDSMINGYMLYTEFDINVSWNGEEPWFEWKAGGELISTHGKDQIVSEQVPEGFSNQPMKFNNFWQIVTPRGYSVMFTHPENRTDLPFFTLSGIVETDKYKAEINFPFLIKKGFSGIIPAGTPIVQIHPFKRESWKMELGTADIKELEESRVKNNHKLIGGYKTQWWSKKDYS